MSRPDADTLLPGKKSDTDEKNGLADNCVASLVFNKYLIFSQKIVLQMKIKAGRADISKRRSK